jgi:hypothetical protein
VHDLADIGDAVARRSEKMKDSAVVPHIVSRAQQFDFSDVSDEPMDTLRGFPQLCQRGDPAFLTPLGTPSDVLSAA